MVNPKIGHHWQHKLPQEPTIAYAHPRTRTNTLENQVTTQGGPTSRDGFQSQTWMPSCWSNHQPGQTITKKVTATKDMVKSGSMSTSEADAAHLPATARSKKKNGSIAKIGRHARSFRSLRGRSTGVEDYNNVNSRCSKMYNITILFWTRMNAWD